MAGLVDLPTLLRQLEPSLSEAVFVFATLPPSAALPAGLAPQMQFLEREGVTLILEAGAAQAAGLGGSFRCRMLTLNVPSSLAAVGLIAAVAARLAAAAIPVNPVAGYHHDHLFVPVERAEEALRLLRDLAAQTDVGRT